MAPGSGLGHLVRTAALGLGLEEAGIPVVILSSSPWSQGFAAITGLTVIPIPASSWKRRCPEYIGTLAPRLIVQDSFPLGFRGERLGPSSRTCPRVCLSRRLKFDHYRDAIRQFGPADDHHDIIHILIEPLADDHMEWITRKSAARIFLDNRICFPFSMIKVPEIPAPLKERLDTGELYLVSHSGPDHEIDQLILRAEQDIRQAGRGHLAVISPVWASQDRSGAYDYFPASLLYADAFRIYTGGGYNSVAESRLDPEKHVMIPFPRLYDDQAWRIDHGAMAGKKPGNDVALDVLLDLCG